MSRTVLPYDVADITALARSLRGQLAAASDNPGHLALLNMLARAAGYRNFQHFRAESLLVAVPARVTARTTSVPAAEPVDPKLIRRLVRYFDEESRLTRWPSKCGHRLPCLWVLWATMPPRRTFDEFAVNRWLTERHLFGDPALLRRELCDQGLVVRTPDCRQYRRVEQCPTPVGLALIRQLGASAPASAH